MWTNCVYMRYSPLFDLTDSSLWEEPYHVRILFVTMMARKSSDQVVYADEYRLRKWSNLNTLDEVKDALRVLQEPDTKRPGQRYEGRRVEKVEGGWLMLNGQKYEDLMKVVNERARKAKWARDKRAKEAYAAGKRAGRKRALARARFDGEVEGRKEGVAEVLDYQHGQIQAENEAADRETGL